MAESFKLSRVVVDSGAVDTLASLLNRMLEGAAPVPLVSPALLLGHPQLRDVAEKMLAPAGLGVVHEAQSFRISRPIRRDEAMSVEIEVSDVNAGRVFDFRWIVSGECFGEMQTRLKFVPANVMKNLKGAAFTERQMRPDMEVFETGVFSEQVVRRYLALAHDPNPIHVDDTAARAVGLNGAVVPGMFFAGVIEAAALRGFDARPIESMKMRFMAPVPVGERLKLAVLPRQRDQGGRVRDVRVFVVTEASVIAGVADIQVGA